MRKIYQLLIAMTVIITSCEKLAPDSPADQEILDGPVEGLDQIQASQFIRGDVAFNDKIFTAETGLGPLFVTNSCGSCHAGDGKGHPFTTLTRFGQTDSSGNKFLHLGAPQLQHRALPGYKPETIPQGATSSKFLPTAVTGLGFLAYVSDADIVSMADPDDLNGDGISGVPNWVKVPDYVGIYHGSHTKNGRYIGRFGRKASVYDLLHQTVDALTQDMGINSVFNPYDTWSGNSVDPEITNQEIYDLVFYLKTLKAPIQRKKQDVVVKQGEIVFRQVGCESCHKSVLNTGYSPIPQLSNKQFHPYTDLLLHDMGSGLDDGYTEGTAKTSEWKTAPLWGLGLSEITQGGQFFLMHDGRARSIEEAIIMHGGEATSSNQKYKALSQNEKDALIAFLKSL